MKIKILPVTSANEVHDQLAAEYDLRNKAIEDGKQNLPAWDSTEHSTTESRILLDIKSAMTEVNNTVGARLLSTQQKLDQISHDLASSFDGVDTQRLKSSLTDLYSENSAHKHYSEYYRDFKVLEPHWKGFREENRINRPAHYPESWFGSFTLVIFVIFIEAILNSYLFAKGNDFGLLGGVIQALIVSILNAGALGFLMGFVALRYLNHIDSKRKMSAGAGALLIVIAVVIFNLAVGHYRQQLIIGSLEPARDALTSFTTNPVALADFEAWLLFFVGLAAFTLSAYKCYHLDDPYPGYGKLDRQFRIQRLRVKDELERLHRKAEQLLDSEVAKLDSLFDEYHRKISEFSRVALTLSTGSKDAENDIEKLDSALKTLLKEYRETNRKVRASRACEHWDQDIIEGERFISEARKITNSAEEQNKEQGRRLAGFKQDIDVEQRELSDRRQKMHEVGTEIIKNGASGFKGKLEDLFHGDDSLRTRGDHLDVQP